MADASESVKSRGWLPLLPLMAAVVAAVVTTTGVLGGAGWWLVKSGRLPVVQGATRVETVKAEPSKTKLVALEPLLVNLADSGGRSYLRVAITFREEASLPVDAQKATEKGKPVNEDEAALRDAALEVLGRQSSIALLSADGKQHLKTELREAVTRRVPEAKVKDVLFTEFLVQQ